MSECSYCGFQNESPKHQCAGCGTDLDNPDHGSPSAAKPLSVEGRRTISFLLRAFLLVIGVGGLALLFCYTAVLILVRVAINPTGAVIPEVNFETFFLAFSVMLVCSYYLPLALGTRGRAYLAAGIVVHALFVRALIGFVEKTDADLLFACFPLCPMVWAVYEVVAKSWDNASSSAAPPLPLNR